MHKADSGKLVLFFYRRVMDAKSNRRKLKKPSSFDMTRDWQSFKVHANEWL